MFSLGIITVFVLLGAAAFSISQSFRTYQDEFRYVAAAVILLIGLHFLGMIRIGFLNRQFQVQAGDTNNMSVMGSYVVGLAFAAGWTPCVGGVLTAVVMTASFEDTAYQGIGLLFVFGLGLTLPFIVAAFFIKPFLRFAGKFRRYLGAVEKFMGLLMVGVRHPTYHQFDQWDRQLDDRNISSLFEHLGRIKICAFYLHY
jgi:cytochrome c-type biogenesis protein